MFHRSALDSVVAGSHDLHTMQDKMRKKRHTFTLLWAVHPPKKLGAPICLRWGPATSVGHVCKSMTFLWLKWQEMHNTLNIMHGYFSWPGNASFAALELQKANVPCTLEVHTALLPDPPQWLDVWKTHAPVPAPLTIYASSPALTLLVVVDSRDVGYLTHAALALHRHRQTCEVVVAVDAASLQALVCGQI